MTDDRILDLMEIPDDERSTEWARRLLGVGRRVAADATRAESDRWRILMSSEHLRIGPCPDLERPHLRDTRCPACEALGDWRASI